ncbi:MAG: glycosyltransferase family 39 protein [Prolixibacteraceae bacterium]|nr:glycosyltransferase family 39 protein [Prolixibacteraceae bacterium]
MYNLFKPDTSSKDFLITVSIGCFMLLAYILGLFIPLTSDAGKYAAISKIIYESGEWFNLTIHFEPYLEKPPLLFWITAPFYFIAGPTAFTFKLPVLLYSLIAVYSTYRFAKIYYSGQIAKVAALILASSEFYFLFHNDIHTDSLLTANVIFTVWQLAEYFKSGKTRNMLLAGLGVGLAMISKGPVGIFVPATAALAHLIYRKQLKLLFNYQFLAGALVAIAVLVAGLAGLYNQFGKDGILFFFWNNNIGRITGQIKGSNTDYLFYFHTTLYIFLPWGILFLIAVFLEFRELFRKKWKPGGDDELFILGGIVFYWIIISFAKAKAPHYFMVLSPFMSILTAKWLINIFLKEKFTSYKRVVNVIQYITVFLIWTLLFVLCIWFFPAKNFLLWISVSALAFIFFIPGKKGSLKLILRRSVISIVAVNIAINGHVYPQLFNYQSTIPACEIFNSQAAGDEMLNSYKSEHRELFFYAKNPGYFLYNSDDLKECLSHKGTWIYTNDEGLTEIQNLESGIEIIKSFKHRSLSKFTLKFFNPATREQTLKNMHLIRVFSQEQITGQTVYPDR